MVVVALASKGAEERVSMASTEIHQTLNAKRDLHVTARHMNGFVSLLNTKSVSYTHLTLPTNREV